MSEVLNALRTTAEAQLKLATGEEIKIISKGKLPQTNFYRVVLQGSEQFPNRSEWVLRSLENTISLLHFANGIYEIITDPIQTPPEKEDATAEYVFAALKAEYDKYQSAGVVIPQILFAKPQFPYGLTDATSLYDNFNVLALVPFLEGQKLLEMPLPERHEAEIQLAEANSRYLSNCLENRLSFFRDIFKPHQHLLTNEGLTLMDIDPYLAPSLENLQYLKNLQPNRIGTEVDFSYFYIYTRTEAFRLSKHYSMIADINGKQSGYYNEKAKLWYQIVKTIEAKEFAEVDGLLQGLQ